MVLVFVVVSDTGTDVQEWPSFHEARVQAASLGASFKVETRRKYLTNPT
jgi:hypothetical protein